MFLWNSAEKYVCVLMPFTTLNHVWIPQIWILRLRTILDSTRMLKYNF